MTVKYLSNAEVFIPRGRKVYQDRVASYKKLILSRKGLDPVVVSAVPYVPKEITSNYRSLGMSTPKRGDPVYLVEEGLHKSLAYNDLGRRIVAIVRNTLLKKKVQTHSDILNEGGTVFCLQNGDYALKPTTQNLLDFLDSVRKSTYRTLPAEEFLRIFTQGGFSKRDGFPEGAVYKEAYIMKVEEG